MMKDALFLNAGSRPSTPRSTHPTAGFLVFPLSPRCALLQMPFLQVTQIHSIDSPLSVWPLPPPGGDVDLSGLYARVLAR